MLIIDSHDSTNVQHDLYTVPWPTRRQGSRHDVMMFPKDNHNSINFQNDLWRVPQLSCSPWRQDKNSPVGCKPYYMEAFLWQKISAAVIDEEFGAKFFSSDWLPYPRSYTASRDNAKMWRNDNHNSSIAQHSMWKAPQLSQGRDSRSNAKLLRQGIHESTNVQNGL